MIRPPSTSPMDRLASRAPASLLRSVARALGFVAWEDALAALGGVAMSVLSKYMDVYMKKSRGVTIQHVPKPKWKYPISRDRDWGSIMKPIKGKFMFIFQNAV